MAIHIRHSTLMENYINTIQGTKPFRINLYTRLRAVWIKAVFEPAPSTGPEARPNERMQVQDKKIFIWNYMTILVVVLAGCASRPSVPLREANHRHQGINRTMSKAEVHQILGQPDRILDDGRLLWRVEEQDYFSELLVRFGPDDSIVELEKRIGK